MRLISMTDFVLEQGKHSIDADLFYFLCSNYAQFLKNPLTLGMFVPTDEDGNVLEEPREDDYSFYTHNNKSVHEEYSEAKERVLFEGWKLSDGIHVTKDWLTIKITKDTQLTIEELVDSDTRLTQTALKQIGIW